MRFLCFCEKRKKAAVETVPNAAAVISKKENPAEKRGFYYGM